MNSTQLLPPQSIVPTEDNQPFELYFGAIFTINFSLMCYLTFKIVQLFRRRNASEFEKKNSRYRLIVYSLMAVCGLLRLVFCALEFQILSNKGVAKQSPALWTLENSPNLVIFSIACVFAYFWHEAASNFDDNLDLINESNTFFKKFLIIINLCFYAAYFALSYYFIDCQYLIAILTSTVGLAVLTGVTLVIFHGRKLLQRINILAQVCGRQIKSLAKFQGMFRLCVISCLLKVIGFAIMTYGALAYSLENYFTYLFSHLNQPWILASFILENLSIVLGELGFFVSVIVLLQQSSYSSKKALAKNDYCSIKTDTFIEV